MDESDHFIREFIRIRNDNVLKKLKLKKLVCDLRLAQRVDRFMVNFHINHQLSTQRDGKVVPISNTDSSDEDKVKNVSVHKSSKLDRLHELEGHRRTSLYSNTSFITTPSIATRDLKNEPVRVQVGSNFKENNLRIKTKLGMPKINKSFTNAREDTTINIGTNPKVVGSAREAIASFKNNAKISSKNISTFNSGFVSKLNNKGTDCDTFSKSGAVVVPTMKKLSDVVGLMPTMSNKTFTYPTINGSIPPIGIRKPISNLHNQLPEFEIEEKSLPVLLPSSVWAGDPDAISSVRRRRKNAKDMSAIYKSREDSRRIIREMTFPCTRNCHKPNLMLELDRIYLTLPNIQQHRPADRSKQKFDNRKYLPSITTPSNENLDSTKLSLIQSRPSSFRLSPASKGGVDLKL